VTASVNEIEIVSVSETGITRRESVIGTEIHPLEGENDPLDAIATVLLQIVLEVENRETMLYTTLMIQIHGRGHEGVGIARARPPTYPVLMQAPRPHPDVFTKLRISAFLADQEVEGVLDAQDLVQTVALDGLMEVGRERAWWIGYVDCHLSVFPLPLSSIRAIIFFTFIIRFNRDALASPWTSPLSTVNLWVDSSPILIAAVSLKRRDNNANWSEDRE